MRYLSLVPALFLVACGVALSERTQSNSLPASSDAEDSTGAPGSAGSAAPVEGAPPVGLKDAATSADPAAPGEGPAPSTSAPQSGLLTAGTWDDNLNFMFFRDYLALRTTTGILPIDRNDAILVEVKDAAGKALPGATVKLLAGQDLKLETQTGGEGRTLLFPTWDGATSNVSVEASFNGKTATKTIASIDYLKADKKVTLTLQDTTAAAVTTLDLAFLIDTTGSMGDELTYLKAEVDDIAARVAAAYPNVSIRYALVLYKDTGDSYTKRVFDFSPSLDELKSRIAAQSAGGGGDWPEAVDQGLDALTSLTWQSTARVAFWTADAPYHFGVQPQIVATLQKARKQAVHIYPIAASGVDDLAEAMLRDAAQVTGGRYLFLTDDSGVGNAHQEPHIPCYYVTRLDQAMERMIRIELSGTYEEPAAAQILRTGGNMAAGQCTLQSGTVVAAY